MKEKRKANPFGALGVALGILVSLTCVAFLLFGLSRCNGGPQTVKTWAGFDEWDPDRYLPDGELYRVIRKGFLTEYPYADGDFRVERKETGNIFVSGTSRQRSLIWLTYDDPAVYEAAKQSHMEARLSDLSLYGEHEAYGFRFYTIGYNAKPIGFVDNWRKHVFSGFPGHFDAFGYNDETRTLIFLSFYGGGKRENKYVELGNSDFPAFLSHYYGEWFDWEAGVGIHLPE